jgi:histidinol dehydrogenase
MISIYTWSQTQDRIKQKIMQRAMVDIESVHADVETWVDRIRDEGDSALLEYIQTFDNSDFTLDQLRVTPGDIQEAYQKVDDSIIASIKKQIELSTAFHRKQKELVDLQNFEMESIPGVIVGQKLTPLDSAGLCVPAGLAPLPTVMQILGVTAKAAGVPRVIACFPPRQACYEMLVAADMAGVDEVYRVGGIAGVAAMAYGTETIKPIDIIAGPGSIYVQAAKSIVSSRRKVAIDMIAGPSEAIILADETANPAYIAADILARAEHSPDASGVLVTHIASLAEQTKQEIKKQFQNLKRQDILKQSLAQYSALVVTDSFEQSIELTNDYSPEHLEVMCKDPKSLLPKLRHAGSIFLGDYAPVAVGDYASGTNHVLPTGDEPKRSSPVAVDTFMKKNEYQYLTKQGLKTLTDDILEPIARKVEGLDAHAESAQIRFKNN